MFTNRLFNMLVVITLLVVTACAPQVVPSATSLPETNTPQVAMTITEAPSPTATPDLKQALVGSWTSTVSKEDLVRVRPEFPQEFLCDNAGTFVWQFNADGTFVIDQTLLPDCTLVASAHIEDVWVLDGNLITFAKGTPDQEIYEIAITGDQLTFKLESSECPPCIAINTANPWTRVE